jgi:hypothetical protein
MDHAAGVAADEAAAPSDEPPRWARVLSRSLVALVLVCGVASVEAWPLSGLRLFSNLRSDERVSYQLRAVDLRGDETDLVFGHLPVAYRNTQNLLPDFDRKTAAEREEICDAWALTPREHGESIAFLRVYRITASVYPHSHGSVREAVYECGRP